MRTAVRVAASSHLGQVAAATATIAAVLALVVVPPDAVQGQPQRLMYVHVPSAWTAYLAFGAVALSALAELARLDDVRWDLLGTAAAELGVAMTALTLVTGSVWGHASWGVWWAWDPRLVSTALLLLAYVAYLAVRRLPDRPGRPGTSRRRAALLGLASVLLVPLVHFSVLWWRTLHQPPTLLRPGGPIPMAGAMVVTLLVALLASLLGGAWYVDRRMRRLAALSTDHPQAMVVPPPALAEPRA